MKRQLLTFVITVMLLAIPKVSFAQSYIYLSQDSAFQRTTVTGMENWVVYKWASTPMSSVTWKAESALRPYVVSAINKWQSIMPSQPWVEVSGSATVEFKNNTSPCPPGAPGCLDVTSWVSIYVNGSPTPSYNWIWRANVHAVFNGTFTEDAKTATIAHEIGHLYGLHERYISGPPVSCGSDVSIMDALAFNGTTTIHCDNLSGPATDDDTRASNYYETGEMGNFQSTLIGSTLKYQWDDLAWADNRHALFLSYYNGLQWVQYTSMTASVNAGLEKEIDNQVLVQQIDPSSFGAPHGRYYRACGWPLFPSWNGTWKCSNSTWWP